MVSGFWRGKTLTEQVCKPKTLQTSKQLPTAKRHPLNDGQFLQSCNFFFVCVCKKKKTKPTNKQANKKTVSRSSTLSSLSPVVVGGAAALPRAQGCTCRSLSLHFPTQGVLGLQRCTPHRRPSEFSWTAGDSSLTFLPTAPMSVLTHQQMYHIKKLHIYQKTRPRIPQHLSHGFQTWTLSCTHTRMPLQCFLARRLLEHLCLQVFSQSDC